MERAGRPVIIGEAGFSVDLLRAVDPSYAVSDTLAAHLLIWKVRYLGMFVELKRLVRFEHEEGAKVPFSRQK